MIAHEFEYVKPMNLAEGLDMLADDDAKPLSGGMSLIPDMRQRRSGKLVDLSESSFAFRHIDVPLTSEKPWKLIPKGAAA